MSNSGDVAQLYKNVIEEVVKNVRNDFVNMGVDEQLWEQKLVETGVFDVQDFPITTSREYHQTGFFYPGTTTMPLANMPVITPTMTTATAAAAAAGGATAAGRQFAVPYYAPTRPVMSAVIQIPPSSLMQSTPIPATTNMNNHQPPSSTIHLVSEEEKASKNPEEKEKVTPLQLSIPKEDSNTDGISTADEPVNDEDHDNDNEHSDGDDKARCKRSRIHDGITTAQTNEINDSEPKTKIGTDAIITSAFTKEEEDAGTIITTTKVPSTSLAAAIDEGGDELGSDLDDEEDEGEVQIAENVANLTLCQYEKITRVRNRWRGVLRAGIVHINGRDYCFSRANMDFDW